MSARGRPRSEEKLNQIYGAAIELFTRHGYDGTSMDKVAEAASVSKQTIYSRFKNKDDLFNAAVLQLCEVIGLGSDLTTDARPVAEVLRDVGRRFLAVLTSPEAIGLYRLVVGNAVQHPEAGKALYRTGPRTFITRLASLLEERTRDGEMEVEEPRMAAAQFFSMLRGELHMRLALGVQRRVSRRELERYVDACVHVFVRGYGGEP